MPSRVWVTVSPSHVAGFAFITWPWTHRDVTDVSLWTTQQSCPVMTCEGLGKCFNVEWDQWLNVMFWAAVASKPLMRQYHLNSCPNEHVMDVFSKVSSSVNVSTTVTCKYVSLPWTITKYRFYTLLTKHQQLFVVSSWQNYISVKQYYITIYVFHWLY